VCKGKVKGLEFTFQTNHCVSVSFFLQESSKRSQKKPKKSRKSRKPRKPRGPCEFIQISCWFWVCFVCCDCVLWLCVVCVLCVGVLKDV